MRTTILTTAIALALLLSACTPALANSWGLPGGLLELFEHDVACLDYAVIVRDQDTARNRPTGFAVFVMSSRYHQELFLASEIGGWVIEVKNTTAVYQTRDENRDLAIEKTGEEAFTLSCGRERFLFRWQGDGHWWLEEATVYQRGAACAFVRHVDGYLATDSAGEAVWHTPVMLLEEFNITLFPRNVGQVTAINAAQSLLPSADVFDKQKTLSGVGEDMLAPVYAAPGINAFYAYVETKANGKAARGFVPLAALIVEPVAP